MSFFEKAFWESLERLFIGEKIEGDSGYVNLMKIKSKYFNEYIKPKLLEFIENKRINKDYKEELFSNLYAFFDRYFSENGSIYYKYTPLYYSLYERVYGEKNKFILKTFDNDYEQILSEKKDVSLFWKTKMLYYIKTDKIISSMEVIIDEKSIYFDTSDLNLKQNNEKRRFYYDLKEINENRIILKVMYSEKNKSTKLEEISKKTTLSINDIKKAITIFERQSIVDYFINKNAKKFLTNQFDLWMYQYLYSQKQELNYEDYKNLLDLKSIAYEIIDYVSKFEDELKKIWEKPRLVLNNNYLIKLKTLKNNESLFNKIINSSNLKIQIQEWIDLGFIDSDKIDLYDKKYENLVIDTKYFKDIKELKEFVKNCEIDGILIKSENFQALNTLKEKYKSSIKAIYIDPPYNTESDEFIYEDKFKSSTYLTMLENRISLAKEFLKEDGVFFCSIANNANKYKESYKVGMLIDDLFEKRFADLIWKRRGGSGSYTNNDITENHEYIYVFGKEKAKIFKNILSEKDLKKYEIDENGNYYTWANLVINQYTKEQRPNMYFEVVYNFKEDKILLDKNPDDYNPLEEVIITPPKNGVFAMNKNSFKEVYKRGVVKVFKNKNKYEIKLKKYLLDGDGIVKGKPLNSLLEDEKLPWKIGQTSTATTELKHLFGRKIDFQTAKPVGLLKLLFYISTLPGDMIMDFFGGSGSTIHAVMELNNEFKEKRKFIVIEMGEHFNEIILPRTKKLMYSLEWKDGKAKGINEEEYIFQYFELEQYEMILKAIEYNEDFCKEYYDTSNMKDPFVFDMKLLSFINNHEELSKKYKKDIDIQESLALGYKKEDFFDIG